MLASPKKTTVCIECRQMKTEAEMTTVATVRGQMRRCCTACQYRIMQARKRGL